MHTVKRYFLQLLVTFCFLGTRFSAVYSPYLFLTCQDSASLVPLFKAELHPCSGPIHAMWLRISALDKGRQTIFFSMRPFRTPRIVCHALQCRKKISMSLFYCTACPHRGAQQMRLHYWTLEIHFKKEGVVWCSETHITILPAGADTALACTITLCVLPCRLVWT